MSVFGRSVWGTRKVLGRDIGEDAAIREGVSDAGRDRFAGATVVLFDFGGTLDSEGVPWKERFHRLFTAEGVTVEAARFDRAFYDADDALVGTVPPTFSYRDTVFAVAEGVARGLDLKDPAVAERVGGAFLDRSLQRLSRLAPLLDKLRRRYRLGIVSNFYGNLATVCRDAGIHDYFSVLVDSAVVGCVKPDPAIFHAALTAVGAEPGEAVFIGDLFRRDVTGAHALGMPCIWLRAPTNAEPVSNGIKPVVVERLDRIEGYLL